MSAAERGIEAAAIYLPKARLPMSEQREVWDAVRAPGIGSTTVPAADEDALTMAVAAGQRVLEAWDGDREAVTSAALATTTPPTAEGALSGRLGMALGLDGAVQTADLQGDLLAGAAALERALEATGPALVTVADAPPGDPGAEGQRVGAGAAAFLVDEEPTVSLLGRARAGTEYPGVRYRPSCGSMEELGVRAYERAAVRESVGSAIDRLDLDLTPLGAAALHQPHAGAPRRLGGALGLDDAAIEAGLVADRIGDAGAAGVPIGLCAAIHDRAAADRTLAAFAGSEGGAAVSVWEGGLTVSGLESLETGVEIDYHSAMRRRGHFGEASVAGGGAYVSLPTWRRTLAQRYRLEAGRCQDCWSVTFPPDGACPACGYRGPYDPVELAREGTVAAVTTISEGAAPPEFAELQRRSGPFATAIVECDAAGGGSARLPAMLTHDDPAEVSIGDTVRATLRRLYEQEGNVRYGMKFGPGRTPGP
ncbi:MAG: OB-fold domain-containing protein [Halobacteriales archaeon]